MQPQTLNLAFSDVGCGIERTSPLISLSNKIQVVYSFMCNNGQFKGNKML